MLDILRWDPFNELERIRGDLERLRGGGGPAGAPWRPASDVYETDDAIVITAELPGVRDEDIDIQVHDGLLTISGKRELHEEIREDRVHRLERSYGRFQRVFRLPPGVREEDIHAAVAYGVLRVSVPKPVEAGARRIPVGSSS
jgi:HSP20 family protein